jgi:hypothetical protein
VLRWTHPFRSPQGGANQDQDRPLKCEAGMWIAIQPLLPIGPGRNLCPFKLLVDEDHGLVHPSHIRQSSWRDVEATCRCRLPYGIYFRCSTLPIYLIAELTQPLLLDRTQTHSTEANGQIECFQDALSWSFLCLRAEIRNPAGQSPKRPWRGGDAAIWSSAGY